ncbi:hypothetical protein T12_742 [Trichinella patagoniensis]|uniref:Uncharacterized protein n=1 Tax=Trichinella patagoniensis TaxID=990121 RepID=A0A0V0ZQK5_9BILA|nr:hypothetical protein T12_742 [Trichinella patagoniensis]
MSESPLERHLLFMDNNNKIRNSYLSIESKFYEDHFLPNHHCTAENVLKSNYSRTCLRENVCKFLFHCYKYAYVALVQGVWCTVRVQGSFPCDEDHGITLNTIMEDGRKR